HSSTWGGTWDSSDGDIFGVGSVFVASTTIQGVQNISRILAEAPILGGAHLQFRNSARSAPMRVLTLIGLLLAGATAPLGAQHAGQFEIGVFGSSTRFDNGLQLAHPFGGRGRPAR